MDDLVVEFLTETSESLDELDNDLVNLEQNPNDQDLLGKIFRLMHTIKGTCGFLDLPKLEKVAHHAENVLGRFRDGDLKVTPAYVTLIFESLDVIKHIVGKIETTGKEPDGDNAGLIKKLDAVYEGTDSEEPEAEASEPVSTDDDSTGGDDMSESTQSIEEQAETPAAPPPPETQAEPSVPATAEEAESDIKQEPSIASQTLRVNVEVLENLMTMVSELVLTRNQLLQILRMQPDNDDFSAPLQRLNHVVSDLQEGVMKTRMQPIGNAWSKLPRIIRDLAMELNKKIDLEMRGQDTELDRQVLELIKDPLTHMVRNSGDHGIETPEERKAAGKPEAGRILLNAYHEGGHIIIEIKDDGKGLSTEKIKEKVLKNGLVSAEELNGMNTQQIQQFIFKAGFSTAEKVTSVSGRGVGMDVVRTNVEKIGGSIELKSVEGKGSTFTIKIPLTLAIVSALIVEASKERFAIPQLSVQELVMASSNGANRIENIKGTPVFRLRDRLLPLVSLTDMMKLKHYTPQPNEKISLEAPEAPPIGPSLPDSSGAQDDASNVVDLADNANDDFSNIQNKYIIVTQVGNYTFGIIVDRVYDTEEIVVKPVSKILRDIDLFSGNTILGDGTVIMILDPNGIARSTGEIDTNDEMDSAQEQAEQYVGSNEKTSLLLFRAGDSTPKAVPLSLVARLENIQMQDVERSNGQMLVQYRETLMPLIPYNGSVAVDGDGDKPILVFSDNTTSLGIIVDEIIDITEDHINIKTSKAQPGLLGSAIINDKATDVVDVAHFLGSVGGSWFKNHGDNPYTSGQESAGMPRHHVLLVDDSPFFRNMISPMLKAAGYDVTSTESANEALVMCEKGARFDLIVSDIEMPDMDGFEFAEKIKSDSNWQNTPLVALTSHATPQDIDRGMQVGFSKYIAKFDRDTLLSTISQTITEHDATKDTQEAAE